MMLLGNKEEPGIRSSWWMWCGPSWWMWCGHQLHRNCTKVTAYTYFVWPFQHSSAGVDANAKDETLPMPNRSFSLSLTWKQYVVAIGFFYPYLLVWTSLQLSFCILVLMLNQPAFKASHWRQQMSVICKIYLAFFYLDDAIALEYITKKNTAFH